jgi:hypothetical protein
MTRHEALPTACRPRTMVFLAHRRGPNGAIALTPAHGAGMGVPDVVSAELCHSLYRRRATSPRPPQAKTGE